MTKHVTLTLLLLVGTVGCNLNPRPLLQNYDDESGGLFTADVDDLDQSDLRPEVDGDTFIGSLAASDIGSGAYSGATFTFDGIGERVCVIVDPQSVWRDDLQLAPGDDGSLEETINPYMNDFPHDDGDVDLLAGLASFYTGTPGVEVGDFFVSFPDSNGVERAIDLNLCLMQDTHGNTGGTAGRATPEWCDFETEEGVTYMGVLQVFSVPVNDDRLRYARQIRSGACPPTVDECTLRGDYDELEDDLPSGYANVEEQYCAGYD